VSELPAVPCEQCGHVAVPELEVVHLTPTTDEFRYLCAACRRPIVTMILGDDDEAIDQRGAELGGWGVEIELDQQGRVHEPRKL